MVNLVELLSKQSLISFRKNRKYRLFLPPNAGLPCGGCPCVCDSNSLSHLPCWQWVPSWCFHRRCKRRHLREEFSFCVGWMRLWLSNKASFALNDCAVSEYQGPVVVYFAFCHTWKEQERFLHQIT